ncbi:hypothetical protein PIB30_030755 [Stylosanthes scabra]|uniref:Uncharacterized protein n=1 Tax=Stylosanthes scabra TaxID=79078 RepID=A0ABU6XDE3_9FABA|nr:hypothetical protein [Stylosanthes scabra]
MEERESVQEEVESDGRIEENDDDKPLPAPLSSPLTRSKEEGRREAKHTDRRERGVRKKGALCCNHRCPPGRCSCQCSSKTLVFSGFMSLMTPRMLLVAPLSLDHTKPFLVAAVLAEAATLFCLVSSS